MLLAFDIWLFIFLFVGNALFTIFHYFWEIYNFAWGKALYSRIKQCLTHTQLIIFSQSQHHKFGMHWYGNVMPLYTMLVVGLFGSTSMNSIFKQAVSKHFKTLQTYLQYWVQIFWSYLPFYLKMSKTSLENPGMIILLDVSWMILLSLDKRSIRTIPLNALLNLLEPLLIAEFQGWSFYLKGTMDQ